MKSPPYPIVATALLPDAEPQVVQKNPTAFVGKHGPSPRSKKGEKTFSKGAVGSFVPKGDSGEKNFFSEEKEEIATEINTQEPPISAEQDSGGDGLYVSGNESKNVSKIPNGQEGPNKKTILLQHDEQETRFALLCKGVLEDFDSELAEKKLTKDNIYWGRVIHINHSVNAVFVEYGQERQGFLAFSEIHPLYRKGSMAAMNKGEEELAPPPKEEQSSEAKSIAKKNPRRGRKENDCPVQRNQWVLVQVLKDGRSHKGASLTTFISLSGQMLVLLPNKPQNSGVSKRITSEKERKELKDIIADLMIPKTQSIILRSAALGKSLREVKKDYQNLLRLWQSFFQTLPTAPALVYEERALGLRVVRDYFRPDVEAFWIQGKEAYQQISTYVKKYLPKTYVSRLRLHTVKERALFDTFGIEEVLENIYKPSVPLPSGGYLVIDQTEALVAIDINSGKSMQERNAWENALKTNLEACVVIAKQVRLRKLSGQIIVDFIDVSKERHEIIEKTLQEALKTDRARIKMGKMNDFCLLAFSRQQVRQSLWESHSQKCKACHGVGRVLLEPIALNQALYFLEVTCRQHRELMVGEKKEHPALSGQKEPIVFIYVWVSQAMALAILNQGRQRLLRMENNYGVHVVLDIDATLPVYGIRLNAEKMHNDAEGGAPEGDAPPTSVAAPGEKLPISAAQEIPEEPLEHRVFLHKRAVYEDGFSHGAERGNAFSQKRPMGRGAHRLSTSGLVTAEKTKESETLALSEAVTRKYKAPFLSTVEITQAKPRAQGSTTNPEKPRNPEKSRGAFLSKQTSVASRKTAKGLQSFSNAADEKKKAPSPSVSAPETYRNFLPLPPRARSEEKTAAGIVWDAPVLKSSKKGAFGSSGAMISEKKEVKSSPPFVSEQKKHKYPDQEQETSAKNSPEGEKSNAFPREKNRAIGQNMTLHHFAQEKPPAKILEKPPVLRSRWSNENSGTSNGPMEGDSHSGRTSPLARENSAISRNDPSSVVLKKNKNGTANATLNDTAGNKKNGLQKLEVHPSSAALFVKKLGQKDKTSPQRKKERPSANTQKFVDYGNTIPLPPLSGDLFP